MFGGSFGSNPTFGSGGFSNTFSSGTTGTVFGQPQASTTSGSLFGGQGAGGGFGQPKAAFGGTSFGTGQTSSMFGQGSRLPGPSSGGLFSASQTAAVSPFSVTGQTQVPAGTSVPFNPISGTDTMMKNGAAQTINTRHQCITCMKEYESKSLEELRLEDYQLNRKGPQQQQGMFGATQPQQTSSLFTSLSSTTAPFGQTTPFGATSTNPTGAGLFSNLSQPKPTGFFSSPATTSAFGAGSSFNFNAPTTQTTSAFGGTTTSTGLGTPSTFSFGQPAALPGTSLFGQKQLGTTAPGFGGFGATQSAFTSTSTANKTNLGFTGFGTSTAPAFGTSVFTPSFGTSTSGGMFSTPAQPAKSFSFSSPFSSQTQPTQSNFGAPTSSAFSFNTPTTAASTLNFGGGSTFGQPGATSFGAPSFGASQPSLGFSFGGSPSTFSGFAPSNTFALTNAQPQGTVAPGMAAFATTPYKDSPLFYNLIANRDLESMIKPTSPAAQRAIKEASRRRASSVTFGANFKNATFPTAKTFNKVGQSIFDGFDEEDRDLSIDILSPKSSVKKLTLKSFKGSTPNHRHSISINLPSNLNSSSTQFDDSLVSEFNLTREPEAVKYGGRMSGRRVSEGFVSSGPAEVVLSNQKRYSGGGDSSFLGSVQDKNGCGVTSTRAGYYIQPPIEFLDKMMDESGNCFVKGLVIGRTGHGEIRFLDTVNIAGIDIDEIVHFRHKEVVVYPDDTIKPPLGSGLNVPAVVLLERVWPIDKDSKNPVKSPQKLQSSGYESVLRKACNRLGAEFTAYYPETGIWMFKVPHFSKYSCELEEAESDSPTASPQQRKGLGDPTVPMQQLPSQKSFSPVTSVAVRPNTAGLYPSIRPTWKSHLMEFDEDHLPSYREFTRPHTSPTLPSMQDESGLAGDDVEHNPLTPSDSNGSDVDWMNADLGDGEGDQYESVLKVKSSSTAVQMMRSALMMAESGDAIGDGDIQPPPKRSRQPQQRYKDSLGLNEIKIPSSQQIKSALALKKNKGAPPIGSLAPLVQGTEGAKENEPFTKNYVVSVNRREEVPCGSIQENIFTEFSLGSANTGYYKAMPRACFGPFGTFFTVCNSNRTRNQKIVMSKITSFHQQATDHPLLYVLEQQLEKQLFWEELKVEEQLCVLRENRQQHKDSVGDRLNSEIMMWELFEMLWPTVADYDNPDYVIQVRYNVSEWLSKYSMELFSDTLGELPHESILGLLKMGRRSEACELAVETNNPVLALLISQTALDKVTWCNCEQQLNVWEDMDAMKFISKENELTYRLCAGLPILDDVELGVGAMTTSQWLQHFSIYLWYCCPPHISINEAIVSFHHVLKSEAIKKCQSEEEEALVDEVVFPTICDSSIPNLCIQLFKLYSFEGYPIRSVLDPNVYSQDIFDYKLSWLLMVYLYCNNLPTSDEQFSDIASAFAHQLEQVGLYRWGVFVMSKTTDDTNFQRRLIESNLAIWGTADDERFLLTNSLVKPQSLVFRARALRQRDEKDCGKIWYMLKSGDPQRAFNELIKFFSVDSILAEECVDTLVDLLKMLKEQSYVLSNWHNLGPFMLDSLQLLKTRSILAAGFETTYSPDAFCELIATFLQSFVQYRPKDVHESAVCIELAVLIQKIVAELMSNEETGKALDEDTVDELLVLPIPEDYKHELRHCVSRWFSQHHLTLQETS